VDVYISVLNSKGKPVEINTNKLQLLENGKPVSAQNIQGTGEAGPLTVLLLIDNSGSMNFANKLDDAKNVAKEFLRQMRPGDQAGIITFNTKVETIQEITKDQRVLEKAIDSITARDDTAIYDALVAGIDTLNPLSGRKAIILLTDGMDNQSRSTPDQVLGSIGFGGLSISTVGFGEIPEEGQEADEYRGVDEDALCLIAEAAGGHYSYADNPEQLSAIYDAMRRALQSEVKISYISPLNLRDGVARALTVTLSDRFQGIGGESQTSFNPGGLVPEVAQPASWFIFGIMLGVLLILLFIPVLINMISINKSEKTKRKKKIKITLKD